MKRNVCSRQVVVYGTVVLSLLLSLLAPPLGTHAGASPPPFSPAAAENGRPAAPSMSGALAPARGDELSPTRALSFGVIAAGTWADVFPAAPPPAARSEHATAYDSLNGRLIVFGGAGAGNLNDVWALSLANVPAWTLLQPLGTLPAARAGHSAIYDAANQRLIVFGGSNGGYLDDVWALSLGAEPSWTQLLPSGIGPTARRDHTAIYDAASPSSLTRTKGLHGGTECAMVVTKKQGAT